MSTLTEALDAAQPSILPSALAAVKLGSILTPLKRTITMPIAKTTCDLTAVDAAGETEGEENPNRMGALKVTTLRVTSSAVTGVLAGGTDATQAFLAIDGPASASFNTVVKATARKVGTAGNAGGVDIACTADGVDNGSNGGASMTQSGVHVTLHYISGQTTVADMERAIRGYGAEAYVEIKTASTNPSYILLVGDDDFTATNLAGGVNPTAASLALATVGSGVDDTVVEFVPSGISSGNGYRVSLVPAAAIAVTDLADDTGTTIEYIAGTSTVLQIETAITAAAGNLAVKTAGTAATVVTDLDTSANGEGVYIVGDTGSTPVKPTGVCGIATISDDGATITFATAVAAFVITYIPLPVTPTELASPFTQI